MRLLRAFSVALATTAVVLAGLAPVAAAAGDLDQEAVRREIGQKYGECVVAERRLKRHAIAFVVTGSNDEAQRLSNYSCLKEAADAHTRDDSVLTGKWEPGIFRKIVADALVRTYFATSGPTDFSAVPPLDPDFSMTALMASQLSPQVQFTLAAASLGECAARAEPEAVRLLAQTDVGSREELAALRGLAPAFGKCMPPNSAVNYPRYLLRDAAVLAYARMAYSLPGEEAAQGGSA